MKQASIESEKLFRLLTENSHDIVYAITLYGEFIYVSPAWTRLLGHPTNLVIGRLFEEFVHPQDIPACWELLKSVMESGQRQEGIEYRIRHADGTWYWHASSTAPFKDHSGKISGFCGISRDITAHKIAEDALRKSEARFRSLFETSQDCIFIFDQLTKSIMACNDAACRLYGYTQKEFMQMNSVDVSAQPQETIRAIDESVRIVPFRLHRKKDGTVFPVEISSGIFMEGDRSIHTGFVRDITRRIETEATLQTIRENFISFFNAVDDMIVVAALTGEIIHGNRIVIQKLGYSSREIMNMKVIDLHYAEHRREAEEICASMFKGDLDFCPLPLKTKAGKIIPAETRVWFGKWDGQDCVFVISKDLSKEQENLQKFNKLFNSNPSPMAVTRLPEETITDVNNAFLNLLGYARTEIIGRTSCELGLFCEPEQPKEALKKLLNEGQITNLEMKVRCKDGKILDGLFSGELIENQGVNYLLTVMLDQTAHKQSEEALRKSEARWQFALYGAGDGVWDFDVVTKRVFFSDQWKAMLGYASHEIGDSFAEWESRVHPEDLAAAYDFFERHLQGDTEIYQNEHRLKCKDGSYKWILSRGKIIEWTEDGKPKRVIGTHTDITERKQAKFLLEKLVQERTADLSYKNILLSKEIKDRRLIEAALKKTTKEVVHKANKLEELNTALKVVLEKREDEREELEKNTLANVRHFIAPNLEKLKSVKLPPEYKTILDLLESSLTDITKPFGAKISSKYLNLTPVEIKVANLVKEGKSIKEIADIMSVSHYTIEFHRFNIRRKLGLESRKINLRTYLLTLS